MMFLSSLFRWLFDRARTLAAGTAGGGRVDIRSADQATEKDDACPNREGA